MLRSTVTHPIQASGPAPLSRRHLLLWGGSALALAGCTQVTYQAPETDAGAAFEQGSPARQGAAATRTWWLSFRDQNLDRLIEAGMMRNLDVRQAVEAIAEARASAAGVAANDLPQISANGAAQRGNEGTGTAETSTAGANVSWMIDVFGANSNSRRAATAELDAAYASADVARLVMQSGIANAYIDLRYQQASVALTRKSLESRRSSLELTKSQFDAGATDRLAVLQAEQLVAEGEAQLPAYETGADQAMARLATLTAQRIATLRPALQRSAGQPRPRFNASVGLPAEVIRARPDLRVAERTYASAVFNIGVAKAAFYPSLSLSGNIQPTNIEGGNITTWALGPSLNLPIFTGGANKANLTRAESRAVQARLAWESAVLNAIEEVESSLAAYRRDARNVAAQQKLVETSLEALDLTRTNFSVGAGAFNDVLDSERSYLQAQQSLAAALQQQAANFISLSVAAAGGAQ
ncbi:efflux transporter outer membrane subunit [Frigidibacter sp.]|uniref:efflux transporter outer membrane subunit n=1 Tax=Frigidibacter sp. TaxID=2586418 RepID=UPI002735B690|nr:efflux transporter outer membrane subunit [Frigidibacter sp.]MDP3340411.1 efflux transporter outer membrane subunit [Frigidibacter sp.]